MNETVTKRFLLYFRLMLLVWILIANAVIHLTGMEYSWLIFLSNIMMFTLEGDVMHSGGSMTGGSVTAKATSLLSRTREADGLQRTSQS